MPPIPAPMIAADFFAGIIYAISFQKSELKT